MRKSKAMRARRRAPEPPRPPRETTLADLQADPVNRRAHPERNLAMTVQALREVGAARSIVIDEADTVLAGNGVTAAAREAGITKLQVIDADGDTLIAVRRIGLTPDQKRALALFDNRTAELAEWNLAQLAADLQNGDDLSAYFFDEELTTLLAAAGPPNVKPGLTDADAVPEPRATAIQSGDLFALGAHRLLCGDCTNALDVARLMGDDRAGLAFTSPPYSDQRTYTGDAADLSPEFLSRFLVVGAPFVQCFAVNLGMVRRGGFISRYWDTYIAAAETAGLGLLSWNVWSREAMSMSVGQVTAMFPIQHEFIFVFGSKPVALTPTVENKTGGEVFRNNRNRNAEGQLSARRDVTVRPFRELGTVVTVTPVQSNTDHPAQFPVELPRKYIEAFPGVIYDPFGGAGTTMLACEQLSRACRSIEIAPTYCQVALDRWEAFTGQKAVKV